jgi:transcriptional regulator with XRE-family HTH domain
MFVGEKIKIIRERKGITQKELAEKSNISNIYLSNLENGIKNNPSNKLLNKIADVLNVTIDELNNDEDYKRTFEDIIAEILKINNEDGIKTPNSASILSLIQEKILIDKNYKIPKELVNILEDAIKFDMQIAKFKNDK